MTLAGAVAALVLTSSVVAAGLALYVASRRSGRAGTALVVLLLALCAWNAAYAGELLTTDPAQRLRWGDLKYVGIGALTPAWLSFILLYTGRGHLVTRRLLVALSVEPLVVLGLLAWPRTHDWVRVAPSDPDQPVAAGPLFWAHLVYTDALLLPATALFVVALVRLSRAYWLQATALAVAALLPWVFNLLFNLQVGPFAALDLTPVVFTGSGVVLAWGLVHQRLLRLRPLARSVLVERMTDLLVVLDAYGHVVDANPAAQAALQPGGPMLGRPAADVLPEALVSGANGREVTLPHPDGARTYEVADSSLPGRYGRQGGRLLVLRDVTDRSVLEGQLRELLAEQARVASQLSHSLRPEQLPEVPRLALAAGFRPAGSGREIGGDFYDVFPVADEWAFTLGDVSGKGARAAAATARARYALRTLALAGHPPADALRRLNDQLVEGQDGATDDEAYLTVAHGRLRPGPDGVRLRLALGGHPQPLVLRASGAVEAVGVPGSAIGLLADAELTDTDLVLQPGDCLFLFTDGVSEARSGADLFGEQALARSLARLAGRPAQEVADALLAEVLDLQAQDASDDIAILVLQAPLGAAQQAPGPRPAGDERAPAGQPA